MATDCISPDTDIGSQKPEVDWEFEMELRVKKEYPVRSLAESVQLAVKHSPQTQEAVAAEVSQIMHKRGWDVSHSPSHFNEVVNNPCSAFYRNLEKLEAIMEATGNLYPLEYMAARRGLTLVKGTHNGE